MEFFMEFTVKVTRNLGYNDQDIETGTVNSRVTISPSDCIQLIICCQDKTPGLLSSKLGSDCKS